MTEHEWLTGTDLTRLLKFARKKATERKLRLFACACCRRFWHVLDDPRCRAAVETGERFADGLASTDERNKAFRAACAARNRHPEPMRQHADDKTCAYYGASFAVAANAWTAANNCSGYAAFHFDWREPARAGAENSIRAALLRDIFGNPYLPVPFHTAWRTPTVLAVAQTIYAERRFKDLPILADALVEAGCTAQELLDHCRERGEHTKGCWAVDLVLDQK